MRSRKPRRWAPVNDVLSSVLRRVAKPEVLAGYQVWTFWDDMVGERIARRAQPAHFRDQVLIVTVANHALLQDLQFMKSTLLDKIHERLGRKIVRDIVFEAGKVSPPPRPEVRRRRLTVGEPAVELPATPEDGLSRAMQRLVEARARRLREDRGDGE